MDLLQLLLRGHGHATYGLASVLLVEESAVADHQRLDTGIGTVEEGLQTTARHAGDTDVLHIDFIIVR